MDSSLAAARRLLACLDLTSLGETDDAARMTALCTAAARPAVAPAALCVYPEWIATVRAGLDERGLRHVPVATVANFPDGNIDTSRVEREVTRAIHAGAAELDVVLPWRALQGGDVYSCVGVVRAARRAAGTACLKVILETGQLCAPGRIREASMLALGEGADFIKTSTGKASVGATPAAAETMLEALRAHGGTAGFKAAGGIRSMDEAAVYLGLAERIMGAGWAAPMRFRIGASALIEELSGVLEAVR